MTREEQIALPPGYGVDFRSIVSVYRLQDGRYAVTLDTQGRGRREDQVETLHATAQEAAVEFERVRKERQLGDELEVEPPDPG